MEQLTMFLDQLDADAKSAARKAADRQQRVYWKVCWDWEGPAAGGFCTIDTPIVPTEAGPPVYAYTERCRLLEERPDGSWLAVIEMGEGPWWGQPVQKWPKDGTRVILGVTDIWPPTEDLKRQREEGAKA